MVAPQAVFKNDLADRFDPQLADLRVHLPSLAEVGVDLVTGAPPFMPMGSGILPQDPQRAAGRFETRGGVEDYYRAAARYLTPAGVAVVLMDGHGGERNVEAARAAGLSPRQRIEVLPRPGRPATYSICVASRQPGPFEQHHLCLREAVGNEWSTAYTAVRKRLDLPEKAS